MYRRDALQDVGWLDECSLVGGEETEMHLRMVKAGWRNVYFPQAEVIHIGGQSIKGNPFLEVEYIKGHLNIHRKHGGRLSFEVLRLVVWCRFAGVYLGGRLTRDREMIGLGAFGVGEAWAYAFSSNLWDTEAQFRWLKK